MGVLLDDGEEGSVGVVDPVLVNGHMDGIGSMFVRGGFLTRVFLCF